ncbi:hypothetical protein D3C81_1811580 [compost metagenome]
MPANNAYTGSRAEHDINGISIMVRVLSFGCSMLRDAITAGTLQPKPIINGMIALPLSPTSSINLSIITVIRAIYPESSINEMIRNIIKICGINTMTPPTPEMIPLKMSS